MENTLYYGDNLEILRRHIKNETIDLIYLDPPFNSKANYNMIYTEPSGNKSDSQAQAFSDFWHWDEQAQRTYEYLTDSSNNIPASIIELIQAYHNFLGTARNPKGDVDAYIVMMTIRLLELYRVLRPTGSIYLHCDPTASHYLKLVLDSIFGENNFRNEIIWHKRGGIHNVEKYFPRHHDTIFFYTKSEKYTFNPLKGDPTESSTYPRWIKYSRDGGKTVLYKDFPKTDKVKFGRLLTTFRNEYGRDPRPDDVFFEFEGSSIDSVWSDLPDIYRGQAEKLGYPTQKPLALLERIVSASSNKGDLVLDPFCGCGTAIDASEKLDRRWIGIDITHLAISVIKRRLMDRYRNVEFEVIGEPKDIAGVRQLIEDDNTRYQFQWWAVGKVGGMPINNKKGKDQGRDGIISFNSLIGAIKVIISVKSGGTGSKDIRDLKGTMEREKAKFGLLLTFEEPSKDMKSEAIQAGYEPISAIHRSIPRIEILTIEDLLKGKQPEIYLIPRTETTFKQAKPEKPKPIQKGHNKKL